MSDVHTLTTDSKTAELFQQMPPADWVRAMIDHYQRTGTYRAADLRRLLGDPTRAVEVGSQQTSAKFLDAAKSAASS